MPLKELVQDLKDFKRFEEIIHVLFKHGFGYMVEKIKYDYIIKRFNKKKKIKAKIEPKKVRYILQDLGGTFVKLGQLLSLRPDLIPKEYCDEFSKLQDDVESFSGIEAKEIMQKEIGREKKISYFSKEPIAAASISQVHEAVLRNDEKIVVKIQRPEIKKKIRTDIDIMHKLARLIEKNYPNNIIKPEEIVQEFERYTEDELDFLKEAHNLEIIHNNFLKDKDVKIPKPYLDLTTNKVLTLEYIEGKKISELKKNKKKIASLIANAIFKQVFIDGVFHADPHPGNILVLGNKIALLDFGIVGRLNEQLKEKLSNLFIAMIQKDLDVIAQSLIDLGVVGNIEIDSLKEDIRDNLSQYYEMNLNQINFIQVFEKLINLAKNHNIKLPINFILLGKCVMTTESVCCSLDQNFNFAKASQPFIKKLIKKEESPENIFKNVIKNVKGLKNFFIKIPEEEQKVMSEIKKVDEEIEKVDEDIKGLKEEIEKTSNRRVLGYVTAALIVAAAIIFSYNKSLSIYLFIISCVLFAIFILSMLRK